jgi:hypothetical protein
MTIDMGVSSVKDWYSFRDGGIRAAGDPLRIHARCGPRPVRFVHFLFLPETQLHS